MYRAILEAQGETKMNSNIKSIEEVLNFGYELFVAGKDVLEPKLDLTKLPAHIIPLYTAAIPAFEDLNQVVPELKSLSEADAAQLVAFISSKGIASPKAEEIIAKSFSCALAVFNLVKAIKA